MKRFIRHLTAAMLIFTLQGCGTAFVGTTTYFYANDPVFKLATVAVVPRDSQVNSLEWSTYRDQMELQLQENGLEIKPEQVADFLVVIDYSIDTDGVTQTVAKPRKYNGHVVGITNKTHTVHQRSLMVSFYGRGAILTTDTKPIAQIRVLSAGSSNELARVMPILSQQAFYKWPGEPGKVYDWTAYE